MTEERDAEGNLVVRLPLERFLPRVVTGYPVVGPGHELYAEQQDGWPTMTPHEAMREAVRLRERPRADSASHPAYDPGYIANPHATRPAEDGAPTETPRQERSRR